ncbi:MAG: DUF421 domain-containing protein [Clostridia bacterium]|jgi:uncharacterized membrane protein YcaP (DUF421 family)|nr:DUF421 domain-containing protein [Clostridia bacterium]MDD3862879.1 DUF421 domain-containing protein [Clostridia bacterium]MDD4408699.1 DUF421 domain-containing protein [Clostridia bacterium]
MGKRQIGQMQPFELVLTLIIADLATIPMTEAAVPIMHGVVPLLTLVVVHYFLTIISMKSTKVSQFISGKPVIIVNPNGVDFKALQKLDVTMDDLFEAMRALGYFDLQEIQYAIMETNGSISILPKSAFSPVENRSLNLDVEESQVSISLIAGGKVMKENLEKAELSISDIEEIMKKADIENIKDILILSINKTGNIYIQAKNQPYKVFDINYKGENLT